MYKRQQHPYTQGLIRCLPKLGTDKVDSVLYPIRGRVPPPNARPVGCVFNPRCDYVQERCRVERPEFRRLPNGTRVRCHFAEVIDPAAWVPLPDVRVVTPDATDTTGQPILEVEGLKKYYPLPGNSLRDVMGPVSYTHLDVYKRQVQNLPPNTTNWLGTDHLGRDTLSRLMVGTQVVLLKTRVPVGDRTVSLPIGVAVWGVLGSLTLGTVLGQVAGYRRGRWDQAIMQLLDAFVAFPSIVLYLVVIAALGPGDLVVILAITITGAPGVARLARGLTLDISTRDYVRAAETRGESPVSYTHLDVYKRQVSFRPRTRRATSVGVEARASSRTARWVIAPAL